MELVRSHRRWVKFLAKSDLVLQNCVGTGSFGDVFAVTRATTGERLAVKRLVARRKISEDVYAMAEIEALMGLTHPNIVALKEVIVHPRMVCLVMELAPLGNLEMLLSESTPFDFDLEDIFRYACFRQVTSALSHCHMSDLAHRDINPSNVLIFDKSLVKLADFNLCFQCSNDVSSDILCVDYLGQDAYLAPEVKHHKPFFPKPADVWSLGCLLYFLIFLQHAPSKEDDFLSLLKSLDNVNIMDNDRNNNAVERNNTSHSLNVFAGSLMRKICQFDPVDRPLINDIEDAWSSYHHHIPVGSLTQSKFQKDRKTKIPDWTWKAVNPTRISQH